jgi:hypothetical protein
MKQIVALVVGAFVAAALLAAATSAGAKEYGLGGNYTFRPSPSLTPAPSVTPPRAPPVVTPRRRARMLIFGRRRSCARRCRIRTLFVCRLSPRLLRRPALRAV